MITIGQPQPKHVAHLTARQWVGVASLALAGLILLAILSGLWSQLANGLPNTFHIPFIASPEPPITCKTPTHPTGDSQHTLLSDGLQRTYLLHLAPSYGRQPQPLIISYHGYTGSAQSMANATRWNPLADEKGFITVYPQGYEHPTTWYAGDGAFGPTGGEDDIQFTRDLLRTLEQNYCIDAHRIYLTGFSLGGGMAYRLACDMSDQITAIGTAAGAYYPLPEGCHPKRPLAIMEIHGAADVDAPYTGYPARRMASVRDYLNRWLALDKCDTTPHVFLQKPDVTGTEWTHCASGVVVQHYRIDDGVHRWPDPAVLNGAQVMWNFFSRFSLPSSATPK